MQQHKENRTIQIALCQLSFSGLFSILLGKVVSFKHVTHILAREVHFVKAINMHVSLLP